VGTSRLPPNSKREKKGELARFSAIGKKGRPNLSRHEHPEEREYIINNNTREKRRRDNPRSAGRGGGTPIIFFLNFSGRKKTDRNCCPFTSKKKEMQKKKKKSTTWLKGCRPALSVGPRAGGDNYRILIWPTMLAISPQGGGKGGGPSTPEALPCRLNKRLTTLT